MEQNRTPRNRSTKCTQFILAKLRKQSNERNISKDIDRLSTNYAGIIGHPQARKINLNLSLTIYIKINSKCIRDFNIKLKIIKLLYKI